MPRKKIPRETERTILTKSRRRCAFCYFYENDVNEKSGQIAHIDRNHANNDERNLVYLCLDHHDRYDSKPSQSKGFRPQEAAAAKLALEEQIKNDFTALLNERNSGHQKILAASDGVSIEVYEKRYPVYAAFWKFVLSILKEVEVIEDERKAFVDATSDALFLFDEEIDQYLSEVHRQAMNLRRTQRTINSSNRIDEKKWQDSVKEEEQIMGWFERELMEGRRRFASYLRLAC